MTVQNYFQMSSFSTPPFRWYSVTNIRLFLHACKYFSVFYKAIYMWNLAVISTRFSCKYNCENNNFQNISGSIWLENKQIQVQDCTLRQRLLRCITTYDLHSAVTHDYIHSQCFCNNILEIHPFLRSIWECKKCIENTTSTMLV